jgi:hypothetical protein
MFTYSQVEDALARVHSVPEGFLGAFRGRIKHFQRIGIVPTSPGKGKKISYERPNIFYWALCLEFVECGIDPTEIKRLINVLWGSVAKYLLEGGAGRDKYLYFYPKMFGRLFREDQSQFPDTVFFSVISDISEIEEQARKAETNRARLFGPTDAPSRGMPPLTAARVTSRYVMINLSHLRREVESALLLATASK